MSKSTTETPILWHHLSIDETCKTLDVDTSGLPAAKATERLQQYGPNRLPAPPKQSVVLRFLGHFHNILIYVLLGSALITAVLDHLIDTAVILAVVITNAVIGFIQEGKAEQAMDAIRDMLAPKAHVIRGGERITINGDELVPGDLVLLEAGDKVPADLRLISCHNLAIQEAILTGESVAVEKHTAPVAPEAPLGDRTSTAFSGTLVVTGQGKGVVTATGGQTEIGRISEMLSTVETLTTPLTQQMEVFAKWLTVMILLLAGLLLAYGYFVIGQSFTELFMSIVGLSVAAIPEGLPAVLTITLAVGVQAMAKRNAIVRRLPAIETIGAVSVICSDKTGTLTRNEMMVASVVTPEDTLTVEGDGYNPEGSICHQTQRVSPGDYGILAQMGRAAAVCNDAALHNRQGDWVVEGDPMEGALLAFAGKTHLDPKAEQSHWTRTDAIPFDASYRYMATLNHNHQGLAFIFLKGAPEALMGLCTMEYDANLCPVPLRHDYWSSCAEDIAAQGQRVLALALKPVSPTHTVVEHDDLQEGVILLGLVGMIDPPRPESIRAVAECHAAGISVKMITGDHAKTAAAIGQQIGLRNTSLVLTGADIDQLDDQALRDRVLQCDIFARTSPEHKLRLVSALQSHQMTVAMTGDGVNDAPALKRADAGIAMGLNGSEAAKEAAELVLADDNFASIVAAVREGRTVYDNLKKVISWTLPTNAGEAMTIIVALFFGMTLPITPVQILWINLITAVTLGIALAFEPTEASTMARPPRDRYEPLLSGSLVWYILFVSLLFLAGVYGIFNYAIAKGYSIELARTLAVNTMVVMEIANLFFIRNIYGTSLTWDAVKGTKVVWLVVLLVTVAQCAMTYLPPLQAVFATASVPFWDGVIVLGIGVASFALIETEKQLRLTFRRMRRVA
jgi:magnesium-transporting ATPase (P-type)